jgi:hypothetical protein
MHHNIEVIPFLFPSTFKVHTNEIFEGFCPLCISYRRYWVSDSNGSDDDDNDVLVCLHTHNKIKAVLLCFSDAF